jgi:uncharacterized repeat protein (TIGR01451 family)
VTITYTGPAFTIEKLQEIAGSGKGFTEEELTGKIDQTVDYQVIVKNAGTTPIKFSKLTDANCEGISPSGETELAEGASETFTCHHVLTATGKYSNQGSITGNEGTGEAKSNEVVVNVPKEPSYTIEKVQEIAGSGTGFSKSELTGKIGQTVDYEVIVKNTGNTPIKFSKLTGPKCEGISPSGEVELASGGEQTYTCHHVLTTTGKYTNQGSITGNEGTGEKTSNEAVLTVQGTCGKTTVGKVTDDLVANEKRVNRCVLPFNALVSELTEYLSPTTFKGQELIKGVIYANSAGKPAALLGVTEQLTFKSTQAAGWYALKFAAPVKLTAGTYWIGVITGNTGKVAAEHYDKVLNAEDYNANTYTSGPSNPFGSFKTTSEEMSLYATFTPEVPPCASVGGPLGLC